CCFFFQAEDGIRDFHVTGVQTCALPIWERQRSEEALPLRDDACFGAFDRMALPQTAEQHRPAVLETDWMEWCHRVASAAQYARRSGRASCRERGEIAVGARGVYKKVA